MLQKTNTSNFVFHQFFLTLNVVLTCAVMKKSNKNPKGTGFYFLFIFCEENLCCYKIST